MRWVVISLIVINVVVLGWQLATLNPVTEEHSAKAPVLKQNVPSLSLLSELELEERQALLASKPRVDLRSEGSPDEPLCTLIGPFPRLLRAEYFVERLAAFDVPGVVREVEIPGEIGYWVYLPAQDTRKQAYETLRELQAKGVDSYVIPKGELENGISFGMFSKVELAQQRLKEMREDGYPAELKEVARSYREVWVVVQPGIAKNLDEEAWQNLLTAEEGLERRQNFCPPVASE
ncbi:SPOR domain-containing protein [Aurantivibrio plasticivorans]